MFILIEVVRSFNLIKYLAVVLELPITVCVVNLKKMQEEKFIRKVIAFKKLVFCCELLLYSIIVSNSLL